MPDTDPSGLKRPPLPAQTSLDPSSLTLSKPNAANNGGSTGLKTVKTAHAGPQRVDVEPIYTGLKWAIGDHWAEYKDAIGQFCLGVLNQSELSLRIDYFILATPEIEHLHNSLITAILANVYREPPEAGVAPFVAANDKPVGAIGTGATGKGGDKVEERLRKEIMALPGRDRRRMKAIIERDASDATPAASAMTDYRLAKNIKLPDTITTSAGGLNKTNWDLEIRKRYANPLAHETLEFPDAACVWNRMLPICYEEALPNGPAEQCSEFVAIATEMFLKDVIGAIYAITRNGNLAYVRRDSSPAAAATSSGANGHDTTAADPSTTSTTTTTKPTDSTSSSSSQPSSLALPATLSSLPLPKRPLAIGDLRIALSLDSCSLGSMPDIVHEVQSGWPEGVLEGWDGTLTSASHGKSSTLLPPVQLSNDFLFASSGKRAPAAAQHNGIYPANSHPESAAAPSVNGHSIPATDTTTKLEDNTSSQQPNGIHRTTTTDSSASLPNGTSAPPSSTGITTASTASSSVGTSDAPDTSMTSFGSPVIGAKRTTTGSAPPSSASFSFSTPDGIFTLLDSKQARLHNTFALLPPSKGDNTAATDANGLAAIMPDPSTYSTFFSDEPAVGWQGSGAMDRESLFGVLDECLAIGH